MWEIGVYINGLGPKSEANYNNPKSEDRCGSERIYTFPSVLLLNIYEPLFLDREKFICVALIKIVGLNLDTMASTLQKFWRRNHVKWEIIGSKVKVEFCNNEHIFSIR